MSNLFGGKAPAAEAAKSDLEKTFADLSARNARGETIGQGELDDKLTRVQQVMLRHDADGSGSFDIEEVEAIVHEFEAEVKRLKEEEPKTEIEQRFHDLSARTLKGETITQEELDEKLNSVQQVMLKHDADGSGSFSLREVEDIVEDFEAEKQKVKSLGKVIVVLLIIIMLALASIFAVSIGGAMIAGEKIKESHTSGDGDMTTTDGNTAVKTDAVESFASIYDLGFVATADLAKLKTLTAYVDKTGAVEGGWVEATLLVAGASKPVNASGVAFLTTMTGDVVKIDGDAATATLTTPAGVVHEVSEEAAMARRRLLADEAPARVVAPLSRRNFEAQRRRRLGFFSALQTSGAFTMMQAGGIRRLLGGAAPAEDEEEESRRLGFFSALMASGSFMMMQAGAF